jgi:hypothetical protein
VDAARTKTRMVIVQVRPTPRPIWWPKADDGWVTLDPSGKGWIAGRDWTLSFNAHDRRRASRLIEYYTLSKAEEALAALEDGERITARKWESRELALGGRAP